METPFDIQALAEFYKRVSAESGVDVAAFQAEMDDIFSRPRSPEDLRTYRLHTSSWKKMSDEIVPVSRFFKFKEIETGRVRFPLDSHPPDAWYWPLPNELGIGIEVTIAQGRARHAISRELVDKGTGRGFLSLPDSAPQSAFDSTMSRSRRMYTSNQALQAVKIGVQQCLKKKNKQAYKGFILLIEANLTSLPQERWALIEDDLRESAAHLPFSEIWIIGNGDLRLRGIQIK